MNSKANNPQNNQLYLALEGNNMNNNGQDKALCLALMRADSEDDVIRLLKKAGCWDDPSAWRYYGDVENNFGTIGNQQSRSDAALVEKIVNAIDARLINACREREINPEGPNAPQSIREAVAMFFEKSSRPDGLTTGYLKNWGTSERTNVARGITIAATGAKPGGGNPCITIADAGEGQTPEAMPDTFLSLNKSNKLRIPFVQGKFNMGGAGILRFCGKHHLQLIVTRRNPSILNGKPVEPSDQQWGFTIVRRDTPGDGRRSSTYTYLAPLDGGVLRFSSATLPIFPDGQNAYGREAEWGTLIKLYEYEATGYGNSNILLDNGLLSRIEILLADLALPVRMHECRPYAGKAGSFETTLTGVIVRLEDGKGQNVEQGFPTTAKINVAGEEMTVTIYAFKKGKASNYRKNEGVIFTINGQAHGIFKKDFFTRKDAGRLSYIDKDILVIADCSRFSTESREDVFMNSRDRLSDVPLRKEIEYALEDLLKNHAGLIALNARRREEEIKDKLSDSKPLEDVLKSILQESPSLSDLFLLGKRLSVPTKKLDVKDGPEPFVGKEYPTYFRLKGGKPNVELEKRCAINMRCRVSFETDAESSYFSRGNNQGEFKLFLVRAGERSLVSSYTLNLDNGLATLSLRLPENCQEGDDLHFISEVTDPTQILPFENKFMVHVGAAVEAEGAKGGRRNPPTKEPGKGREIAGGIELPQVLEFREEDWVDKGFDRFTALQVRVNSTGEVGQDAYDFEVNMDNSYLKMHLKSSKPDELKLTEERFKLALVLLGLALLYDDAQARKTKKNDQLESDDEGESIRDRIASFTRAAAPVLLPMIESLSALSLDKIQDSDTAGDDY